MNLKKKSIVHLRTTFLLTVDARMKIELLLVFIRLLRFTFILSFFIDDQKCFHQDGGLNGCACWFGFVLMDNTFWTDGFSLLVCMILPGGGCRLQTCRGIAA